jgi:hypothetical protein
VANNWGKTYRALPAHGDAEHGTRLKKDCTKVNGQPPDLLSTEQVIQKYRLCTEDLLAEDKMQASIRMTLGLEELNNAAKLMDAVANQKD